jgi:lincosamide and streptogramin A transport system ATP-binding/permease protein
VSHDRVFLDECVDHILSINRANIEIISGNFSTWWEQKALRDASEIAENEKLKKDIKRLEAAARQSHKWADNVESAKKGKGTAAARKKGHVGMDTMAYNAEQSRRMQQRRKNLERRQTAAIEEKSNLLKNIEEADELKIHPLEYYASRLMFLENVSVAYDGREIFHSLGFEIERGDRIALVGGNGSGKSSIIKLVCGEDIPYSGTVSIGSNLAVSYVPQDASFLTGDLSGYAADNNIERIMAGKP